MAGLLGDVRLVAVIDTALVEPPDTVPGSWWHEPPRQRDLPRILASWRERDLVPRDTAPEFVARSLRVWQANQDAARGWRPSPYPGLVDVFGSSPATLLPTATHRTHQCSTSQHLVGALRKLLG